MKSLLVFVALLGLGACAKREAPPPAGKALSCEAGPDGAVSASGAWVREQQNPAGATAAYFTVCNGAMAPVVLVGLSTPLAGAATLHETTRNEAGVVSMAPMGEIALAPGERILFAPGGRHAMLMDLKGPIAKGETATLTLDFAGGLKITVDAIAKSAVEAAQETGGHEGQ